MVPGICDNPGNTQEAVPVGFSVGQLLLDHLLNRVS